MADLGAFLRLMMRFLLQFYIFAVPPLLTPFVAVALIKAAEGWVGLRLVVKPGWVGGWGGRRAGGWIWLCTV